jgi:hypothetical protein
MRRRDFLGVSTRAAFGASLLFCSTRGHAAEKKAPAPISAFDDATVRRIDRLLPKLMRDTAVPGVSLAIIRDGRLAWQRAFGVKDSASSQPADEGTAFEAASVSKTVFAYAALKLCETAETIQDFWTGHGFHRPDEGQMHSYHLALVLTRKLTGDLARFRAFLREVDATDHGTAALEKYFHTTPAAMVTDYLGDGDWETRLISANSAQPKTLCRFTFERA